MTAAEKQLVVVDKAAIDSNQLVETVNLFKPDRLLLLLVSLKS